MGWGAGTGADGLSGSCGHQGSMRRDALAAFPASCLPSEGPGAAQGGRLSQNPLPLVPAPTARCRSLGPPSPHASSTRTSPQWGAQAAGAGRPFEVPKGAALEPSQANSKDQVSSGDEPSSVAFAAHFHGVNTANVTSLSSVTGGGVGRPPGFHYADPTAVETQAQRC